MDPRRSRAIALTLGAAVAALIWLAWSRIDRGEPASVSFHRMEPATGNAAPGAASDAALDPAEPRGWRYFLPEEEVGRLFGFLGDPRHSYDPWVYFRDSGNNEDVRPLPEHPEKRWRWRTNSLGLREDRELDDPPRERRVLVAGDSHTCGLCNNRESFANLLEADLARAHPGPSVEVLNAGFGGYSFPSYFGTLMRFRSFAPQAFVVTVFGGNDFVELVYLEAHFAREPLPTLTEVESARRAKALELSANAMGQGLNSLDTFRCWPEAEPAMVRAALRICTEMEQVSRSRGTPLILVFLPSPFDLAWPKLPKRAVDARAALELNDQDLQQGRRLAASFVDGARGAGLQVIDMRPIFEREERPPYWGLDFHLDLRGHALVAAALRPALEAILAGR